MRRNSIPQLFVLPPFFSRFDDPVNYAFRSEPFKKETEKSKLNVSSNLEESPDKTNKLNLSTELNKLKNIGQLNDIETKSSSETESNNCTTSSDANNKEVSIVNFLTQFYYKRKKN